jgi:tetratricopeptide (TPR) repeat protein
VLSIAGLSLARPVVGASGAVSVIMGAFAVRFYRTPLFITPRRRVQFPAAVILGAFLGLEVRRGLLDAFTTNAAGGVANWAHVGGFFAGAVVSFATGGVRQARRNVLMQRKADSPPEGEELLLELADIVRRDPDDGDACFRLAFELDRLAQEPEAAVRYYGSAIRTLSRQGNRRRAIEAYVAFARTHDLSRLDPSVHAIVATCYETTEQFEAALRVCELIAEVFPDRPAEAETALAEAMDIAANALRDLPRARAAAGRLLASFPGSPHTERARRLAAWGNGPV